MRGQNCEGFVGGSMIVRLYNRGFFAILYERTVSEKARALPQSPMAALPPQAKLNPDKHQQVRVPKGHVSPGAIDSLVWR